jgi:DNA repair protein RadD
MIELRPYQRAAVDALYAYFGRKDGNPLVVIPTAGGKSLIIATFIREAIEQYPDTRVLILTHVRELIRQNYEELLAAWPGAPAGVYSAGEGRRELNAQILFAGIQSIHKRAYEMGQRVDLVLIDEAHLIPRTNGTMYRRFLDDLTTINPYTKILGLTATPFRLDSGMLHKGDGALFTDIAYEANVRDLIEQGYLSRPITVSGETQIDTSRVGTRLGEFIAGQLQAAAMQPGAITGIADEIVRHGESRSGWLVFGTGIEHCELLRMALIDRGISCGSVYGHTPKGERDQVLGDFKAGKIRALSSMGVLTTGFNARHVDMIALARPTKSPGLYIQMVGRGTRLFPGKEDCLILDFGGNIARHGPIDRPRVRSSGVKEPGEGLLQPQLDVPAGDVIPAQGIRCPICWTINDFGLRHCSNPECGRGLPQPGPKLDAVASDLPILSDGKEQELRPEWVEVDDVAYGPHSKPGKPPSLKVTYRCGLLRHQEWVCFEHIGYPRRKAETWWRKRAPDLAVPDTVNEALANAQALARPKEIAVRQNGRFTEIVGATF